MIKCWEVKPPVSKRWIVSIVKLDMSLFDQDVIAAGARVGALTSNGSIDPLPGGRWSLGGDQIYLVEFNDGTVARSNGSRIVDALRALGQERPW